MILILGVTASGKGRLAFDIAKKIGAEIISIDSMKVYRRMDIGTAKPSIDRRSRVRYHLIDVVEPSQPFSAGTFLELTEDAIDRIKAENKPIVAVGGTAMYLKALLYGLFDGPGADAEIRDRLKEQIQTEGTAGLHAKLTEVDPNAAARIHLNDARRIVRALEVFELTGKPISSFQSQFESATMRSDWKIIGLDRPKPDAASRINQRVKKMIDAGLIDEVKSLLAEEKPLSKQARCAIGYAETISYLKGEMTLEKAVEKIKINTRRFAKSQRTWFKTFKNVNWLEVKENEEPEQILNRTTTLVQS